MKRTSLAKRNRAFPRVAFTSGTIVLIIVLIVLVLRFFAPNTLLTVTTPIFEAGNTVTDKVSTVFTRHSTSSDLVQKNETLTEQNTALALQNRTLTIQVADLLKLATTSETKAAVTAGVIARPPTSPYDSLIIAAGNDNGVTVNMEAFGNGGVPIGVVTAVTARYARVTLFSSPHEAVDGWIGDSHIPVTLKGEGAGSFSASVPSATPIHIGDVVTVPGPGAYPIGVISQIDGDSSLPTEVLRITPAINLFSVTWVALHTAIPPILFNPAATSSLP